MLHHTDSGQEMIRSLKEDSGKYARERETAARRNRQPGERDYFAFWNEADMQKPPLQHSAIKIDMAVMK